MNDVRVKPTRDKFSATTGFSTVSAQRGVVGSHVEPGGNIKDVGCDVVVLKTFHQPTGNQHTLVFSLEAARLLVKVLNQALGEP